MKSTEFVDQLKNIPNSVEDYKQVGLTIDFINKTIKSYNPLLKTPVNPLCIWPDEVIRLVNTYDMVDTTIGMISFENNTFEKNGNVFFGSFEVDMLFVDIISGEIRCYEENTNHLLYRCAINGESFLNAIFEAGRFLEKRSINETLYNDELLGYDIAEYCAKLAGGKQYSDFYRVLLS